MAYSLGLGLTNECNLPCVSSRGRKCLGPGRPAERAECGHAEDLAVVQGHEAECARATRLHSPGRKGGRGPGKRSASRALWTGARGTGAIPVWELTGLEAEMLGEASRLSQGLGIRLSASGNTTPESSLTPEERERPWAGCSGPGA